MLKAPKFGAFILVLVKRHIDWRQYYLNQNNGGESPREEDN